jgi:hypothetical protein
MEITDPVMPDPRPQENANVPAGGKELAAPVDYQTAPQFSDFPDAAPIKR